MSAGVKENGLVDGLVQKWAAQKDELKVMGTVGYWDEMMVDNLVDSLVAMMADGKVVKLESSMAHPLVGEMAAMTAATTVGELVESLAASWDSVKGSRLGMLMAGKMEYWKELLMALRWVGEMVGWLVNLWVALMVLRMADESEEMMVGW